MMTLVHAPVLRWVKMLKSCYDGQVCIIGLVMLGLSLEYRLSYHATLLSIKYSNHRGIENLSYETQVYFIFGHLSNQAFKLFDFQVDFWETWNSFRLLCDHHSQLLIVLDILWVHQNWQLWQIMHFVPRLLLLHFLQLHQFFINFLNLVHCY